MSQAWSATLGQRAGGHRAAGPLADQRRVRVDGSSPAAGRANREGGGSMATEENKAIVRRWFEEVWNQRHVAAIDALAAESFTLHHVALPSAIDLQTYKHYHPAFMAAFPDFHIEIDDIIAEGDRVAVRITQRATHRGEFMGIPPTGKQVAQRALTIYRVEGGKLVEAWAAEPAWG